MQKPEYIKISLPITKKNTGAVIKRYFIGLRNQYVEVQFFNIRKGKIYKYKVEKLEEFKKDFMGGKKINCGYNLILTKNKF